MYLGRKDMTERGGKLLWCLVVFYASVACSEDSRLDRQPSVMKAVSSSEALRALLVSSGRTASVESTNSNVAFVLASSRVHALSTDMAVEDVNGVLELLNSKFDEQDALSILEVNAVKNDALDKLIRQKKMHDGLSQRISEMFHDRRQDTLWRDYCIQHLQMLHEAKWPTGRPSDIDQVDAALIKATYWEAVEESDSTIAGTALIGLERISLRDPDYNRPKIARKALAMAGDETCSLASRIAAVQVCVKMSASGVLPIARAILRDRKSSTPLQMACVAALVAMGSEADDGLLDSIEKTGSPYVRRSVTRARKDLVRAEDRQTVKDRGKR